MFLNALVRFIRPSPRLWRVMGWLLCALPLIRADEGPASTSSTVSRGSLRGFLMPIASRQLGARGPGVVEKIGAAEGQFVKEGDLLVQLNADVERADVSRAMAMNEVANSEINRTKRDLDQLSQLRKDSIGSQKSLDDARYAYEVALGRQKQAIADLEMAQARLNERKIVAPISGLLFRRNRDVGESVDRQEIVVRLIDVTKLELVVYAGAELLGKFKTGGEFRIMIESGPAHGTVINGVVFNIDPVMDPESGTFRVRVQVQPSEKIQPGMAVALQLPSEVN
jgi:RND family efflux transporter MFP subunit